MLVDPGQTSYDLRFRLFGTPVRVHPFFWLFSAIFGWDYLEMGFGYLLGWIVCCFVSILLHEFGHVWMGRIFGARDSYIVLYSFGGLAVGSNDLWNRWQRIAVSLAGPGIQLALYGLLWLTEDSIAIWLMTHIPNARTAFMMVMILGMLQGINLMWPLFNLLPIWPLDGGVVSREICTWLSPHAGLRFSLGLSMLLAGFIAIHALLSKANGAWVIPYLPTSQWTIILFGVLAFQSWQLLQMTARPKAYETDDRLPWESDPDAWKR